ncbi:MAG: fluoride efflux transporter CrcB [Bacteroidales bacterium]
MFKNALLVFLGGGIGSLLRYYAQSLVDGCWQNVGFPLGTFVVNFIGSLLIGIALGMLGNNQQHYIRFLFVIGFCGGFTTFSAFTNDSLLLINRGAYGLAALYAVGSVAVCIGMTGIGYFATKMIKK